MIRNCKKLTRFIVFITGLILVLGVFYGCDKGKKATITLSHTQVEIAVGEQFTVTSTDDVSWQTSNAEIATVDDGVITAISEGSCTVTASSGSAKGTVKVTVTKSTDANKITSFSSGIGVSEMFLGDTVYVLPTLKIQGEIISSGVQVNYQIANGDILTIANGVLTATDVGSTTVTATCEYNGTTYSDVNEVTVVDVPSPIIMLADTFGNTIDKNVMLINCEEIENQITVKYFSSAGASKMRIEYSSTNDNVATFNIVDSDSDYLTLSLYVGGQSALTNGKVIAQLTNGVTTACEMQMTANIGGKNVECKTYKTFIKQKEVYTDFAEFDDETNLYKYVKYDFSTDGGKIEVTNDVLYNGLPTLKVTAPTGLSYVRFSDLVSNYQKYGLTVGSKITIKMHFDGNPKVAGTNYYAVGKITSANGVAKFSSADILGYDDARNYVSAGLTEWRDVTYVLDESSFPLVDLGVQISGNSQATERFVYIAYITVVNPDGVDYTVDFSKFVTWDNTGRNSPATWWGYSSPVANKFVIGEVPSDIALAYNTAYGTTLTESATATPNVMALADGVVLQNSSCAFSNTMKGLVFSGKNKIRIRVYMSVSGTLPADSSVTALTFLRNGTSAGYGFSEDKLQTLAPNVWTELTYDVASEYLQADLLTVAFNLKNYIGSSATVTFYLGSIAFVN